MWILLLLYSVFYSVPLCFSLSAFFINLFICLFYFWPCWVFVAVRRLSLVAASGGFSCCGATGVVGSRCTGVSSCGTQAQ